MKQPILTHLTEKGRAVLSQTAADVDLKNGIYIRALVADLVDTAKACKAPTCAGLAAHQIGRPVRAFVMQWGAIYRPIINPVVIEKSTETRPYWENCLSRPGLPAVKTKRHKTITLEFHDLTTLPGKPKRETFRKRDAVVVQHELDHLQGIMI